MATKPMPGEFGWGTKLNDYLEQEIETAIAEASARLAMLSFNVFDPTDPQYGALRDDNSPAARTINDTAISAAAADAKAAGGILYLKGLFYTSTTIEFQCHVAADDGVIRVADDTIVAIRAGTTTSGQAVRHLRIVLPKVYQESKVDGSGVWGTDSGVEIANLNDSDVTIPHVQGFETNLHVTSLGTGVAYNIFRLGNLGNGKINLHINPQAGGWVNENLFEAGRYWHRPTEGTAVAGTRQIKISSNGVHPVNNNRFAKPSLEGNVPEYHVDMVNAQVNVFEQARWEATPPRVRLENSLDNDFDHGYEIDAIQWTLVGTNLHQKVLGRQRWWLQYGRADGGLVVQNQSSGAYPAITVMPSNATLNSDPATAYVMQFTGSGANFKATGDTHPRIEIDAALGRINGGSGSVDPGGSYIRPFSGRWQCSTGFGMYGVSPPVTQPAANPDTTGATLAELETEVNQLKALLRSFGLMAA